MVFPEFYDADKVGQLYAPRTQTAADAGKAAGLAPASEDKKKVLLLLVDVQVDFVHEDGALSVPGAVADTRRTIEWLYRHLPEVTHIAASLDSHIPLQIFFPTWWEDSSGHHPNPFTPITPADLKGRKWHPLYEADWSLSYVEKLQEQARKDLMIWPYHTLIGTTGHSLTPSLYEAIAYHSAARQAQPTFLSKGTIPKTEHYSMLEPEVKVPEVPMGNLNTDFLQMIADHDLIYVAGQAKSHCVLETVNSMMRYYGENHPQVIGKMRILTDCMSSVAHPVIDFEAMANEAFAAFQKKGLALVQSTDAVG